MTVVCYPVKGKQKAIDICQAFADGCGGIISHGDTLLPGDAFFYGVNESNLAVWRAVVQDQTRNYFYCDNAYFDSTRQTYFRITKNALQHSGRGNSDCRRFCEYGVLIKPWRHVGDHIVLIQQSDSFMELLGGGAKWYPETAEAIRNLTKRSIRLRNWNREKADASDPLSRSLTGAHALVTWSSAAAINAVLAGIPVVVMGQCAAEPFSGSLLQIDNLPQPDLDRHNWSGVLADNQWTIDEIRKGMAWERLRISTSPGSNSMTARPNEHSKNS